MVRILYFMTELGNGGVEKMVTSFIENMDKNKVHIDIVPQGIKNEEAKKYLESLGCHIYDMPYRQREILKKFLFIRKILKKNHYDAVHVHASVIFDFLPLIMAKHCGIKSRIIHSHSTTTFKNSYTKRFAQKVSKLILNRYVTDYFACSKQAALTMFGNSSKVKNNLIIIKNGIDIQKFKFNIDKRISIREENKLSDKLVFGHIGRFNEIKNHKFLIDIFYEITKLRKDAILLLIGEGKLMEECRKQVNKLGIANRVRFLGVRNNVNEIMQAMDMLIFPSLSEGLGIVLIEAQCSGLQCLVSQAIVDEAMITDHIKKCDLQLPAIEWANRALNMVISENIRENAFVSVAKENYSIESSSKYLENFYLNLFNNANFMQ